MNNRKKGRGNRFSTKEVLPKEVKISASIPTYIVGESL